MRLRLSERSQDDKDVEFCVLHSEGHSSIFGALHFRSLRSEHIFELSDTSLKKRYRSGPQSFRHFRQEAVFVACCAASSSATLASQRAAEVFGNDESSGTLKIRRTKNEP